MCQMCELMKSGVTPNVDELISREAVIETTTDLNAIGRLASGYAENGQTQEWLMLMKSLIILCKGIDGMVTVAIQMTNTDDEIDVLTRRVSDDMIAAGVALDPTDG